MPSFPSQCIDARQTAGAAWSGIVAARAANGCAINAKFRNSVTAQPCEFGSHDALDHNRADHGRGPRPCCPIRAEPVAGKKRSIVLELLSHFWGPIPWMIEVAAVLSALVRRWPDLAIILTLLMANAAIGFGEEFQAGNAIAALKANLALKARAKCDGAWIDLDARALVPGDLIHLRLGDIVPADTRLLEGEPVELD